MQCCRTAACSQSTAVCTMLCPVCHLCLLEVALDVTGRLSCGVLMSLVAQVSCQCWCFCNQQSLVLVFLQLAGMKFPSTGQGAKVKVVPRPSPIAALKLPTAAGGVGGLSSNSSPASVATPASSSVGSTPTASPQPGCVNGATLIAFVGSLRWHVNPSINMLRQSLAATMVRRMMGPGGKVSPGRDCNSCSMDAAEAGEATLAGW